MPLRALASSSLPHQVTPIGPAEASRYGLSPEQARWLNRRWLNRRWFDTPTLPAASLHTQLLAAIAAGKL